MVSNWEEKFLDELCCILDSKRVPITKKDRNAGIYPYYGATGVQDYIDSYIFDETLLLVGEDGAKWGRCENTAFIVTGKFWVNNHAHILKIKKDTIYEWLKYYLNYTDLSEYITGTTVPKLNQEKLKQIKIPIPKIDEQKRIAAKLDNAFQKIEALENNTKENIKNIEDLFKSYLNKVLNANDNYYKTTPFEECLDKVPNTAKINSKKFLKYGKYPIISQEKEFINGYWDNDADVFKVDTAVIIFGDHTKNIKYVDFDFIQGADGIKILKPKNFILPKYFFYYLNSLNLRNLGYARHYKLLKEHLIRYPEKIEEQKKIVDKLDIFNNKIQTIKQNYQNKINLLDNLKKSILNKAFKGEL